MIDAPQSGALGGKLRSLQRMCDTFGWIPGGHVDADRRFVNVSFRGVGDNAGRIVSIVGTFDRCTLELERVHDGPRELLGAGLMRGTRRVYATIYRSPPVHLREALKRAGPVLVGPTQPVLGNGVAPACPSIAQ